MAITIVGIDCATVNEKTGLALAQYDGQAARIEEVAVGSKKEPVVETVAQWIAGQSAVLIALDAPLGWPAELGQALCGHEAGRYVPAEADVLFRRTTDKEIKRRLGKQPLDVGADRIARTALAALKLLQGLRERTGEAIPLAWNPAVTSPCAIEVYPAATLAAHGVEAPGYKGKEGRAGRRAVLRFLAKQVVLPDDAALSEQEDHALDAVLCVLAGVELSRKAGIIRLAYRPGRR